MPASSPTLIATTERLLIRQFTLSDAEFIVNLLNQPTFIENIADKQVRTIAAAENYLRSGPLSSYQQFGFGLYAVELRGSRQLIGMCGILKRTELEHPDIGYALLPDFCGQGYALEAARVVLAYGMNQLGLSTLLAITKIDNQPSNKLLEKLGMALYERIQIYGSQNNLYVINKQGTQHV